MLSSPSAVVADPNGGLWIADTGHGRVLGASSTGEVHAVLTGGMIEPRDVAVDAEARRIYVADPSAGAIFVFDRGEDAVATLDCDIDAPAAVAIDEFARVVYAVAGDGAVLRAPLGGGAAEPLGLDATRVVLAPDRTALYATDGDAVYALDLANRERRLLARIPGARLAGLVVTPAGVAAADPGRSAIVGVNPRHGTTATIWTAGLAAPAGVAFDRISKTYVIADTGHGRVVRVARDISGVQEIVLSSGDPV
jgi:DNA-binding beta-propeller fold protein YncE